MDINPTPTNPHDTPFLRRISSMPTLILILVVMFFCLGGAYWYFQIQSRNQNAQNTTQDNFLQQTTNGPPVAKPTLVLNLDTRTWQTFSSNYYGYSLKFPPDWTISESEVHNEKAIDHYFSSTSDYTLGRDNIYLTFQIRDANSMQSPSTDCFPSFMYSRPNFINQSDVDSNFSYQIGGEIGTKYLWKSLLGSKEYLGVSYAVVHNQLCYTFNFEAGADKNARNYYTKLTDKIIVTLTFTQAGGRSLSTDCVKNGYCLIKELGIKFSVPPDLQNLYYAYSSGVDLEEGGLFTKRLYTPVKIKIVSFSTRDLDLAGCPGKIRNWYGPVGSLIAYPNETTLEEQHLFVDASSYMTKINNNYYYYTYDDTIAAACPGQAQAYYPELDKAAHASEELKISIKNAQTL